MATSSIFQSFCIRDKKKIYRFVNALEKARYWKASKPVTYSRPVEVVHDKEEIRNLFRKKKTDE